MHEAPRHLGGELLRSEADSQSRSRGIGELFKAARRNDIDTHSSGGNMREETFAGETDKCRDLALRYPGGPEYRLLINLAVAFEELARKAKCQAR